MADYERMVQDLMQVYGSGAALSDLRYDQPYTSRDPGTKYRSGELTSDVGLLDPVDAMADILSLKGATLARQGAKALRPAASRAGRATRQALRNERGSLGRAGLPEPNDFGIPPEMLPKIQNARRRIEAAMTESSEASGDYDIPEMVQWYDDAIKQKPGEHLTDYVQRLLALERRYNPDKIYGPGAFPPSELPDVLKQLGTESKTPLIDTNLRPVTPPAPAPPEPRHLWETLKKRRDLQGGGLSDELRDETLGILAEQGPDALDKSTMANIEKWWFHDMETRDVNRVLRDYLERAGGFQREPAGTVGGSPTWMNPQPPPRTRLHLPWEAYGREAMDIAPATPMPGDKIAGIKAALDRAKELRNQEGIDYWSRRLAHALERSGGAKFSGGPY